jgi:hypothetical protein
VQRKVVTVLFCDVVGSTALGESVDPEALRGAGKDGHPELGRALALYEQKGNLVMAERTRAKLG